MKRNLVLLSIGCLLLIAMDLPAAAADPAKASGTAIAHPDPVGQWVLNLGTRTLFVLAISDPFTPGQSFSGAFTHPRHFQSNGSTSFSHIAGPAVVEPIVASQWKGPLLSITVRSSNDSADESTYLLDIKDASHAQLQIQGIPIPPFSLQRATGPVSLATDWDAGRTYTPDEDVASNPQMRRIFEEDQNARLAGLKIDWAVVNKSDAERRQATLKLLNDGALHSGEDFNWAAFVYQHGSTPEDYLLAHTLAMIAVAKGYREAVWISTATLDRYLQSIGQPQIYGTQFKTPAGAPTTQEPFNRTLISDPLRFQLGVPSEAAQETQRKQYDTQRSAP